MHEQRVGVFHKNTVIGLNVRVAERAVVPAGGYQDIPFNFGQENFPPNGSLAYEASMRSRASQLGLTIAAATIAKPFGLDGEQVVRSVRISNVGARHAVLPENLGLFRLYRIERNIVGQELRSAIGHKSIQIFGEQGTDWDYVYDEEGEISGVYLRLDPNTRRRIRADQPVEIPDKRFDYRRWIDSQSVDIIATPNPSHYNVDTVSRVKLGRNVASLIQNAVYFRRNARNGERIEEANCEVLQSRFIDAGSNWNIRVEIFGPTINSEMPDGIEATFMRAA